jgi:hypothetical protein
MVRGNTGVPAHLSKRDPIRGECALAPALSAPIDQFCAHEGWLHLCQ